MKCPEALSTLQVLYRSREGFVPQQEGFVPQQRGLCTAEGRGFVPQQGGFCTAAGRVLYRSREGGLQLHCILLIGKHSKHTSESACRWEECSCNPRTSGAPHRVI